MSAGTTPEVLGRALAAAPDPELARVALSRVGESPVARDLLAEPAAVEAAVRLLGFSSAAADFLVAHPEEAALFTDAGPRDVDDLLAEAAGRRVAVMCSESVWWRCHRRLVADVAVLAHGVDVRHLMPDGSLRPHRPAEGARLTDDGELVWDGA